MDRSECGAVRTSSKCGGAKRANGLQMGCESLAANQRAVLKVSPHETAGPSRSKCSSAPQSAGTPSSSGDSARLSITSACTKHEHATQEHHAKNGFTRYSAPDSSLRFVVCACFTVLQCVAVKWKWLSRRMDEQRTGRPTRLLSSVRCLTTVGNWCSRISPRRGLILLTASSPLVPLF